MQPTIQSFDLVLIENFTRHFGHYSRDDIVVCRSVRDPSFYICKRIQALAGDLLPTRRSFFSTILSNESCWPNAMFINDRVVPEGHVWLQGDNNDNSDDSRHYGPVPTGMLRGRVIFRFWPPTRAGFLS